MLQNGKKLTCRAENVYIMNSIITDETILDITYSPVVNLSFIGLPKFIIKGRRYVKFECNVTANPDSYVVFWKKDGKQIQIADLRYATYGWNHRYYRYTNNDKLIYVKEAAQNEGSYVCEAINAVGSGSSNDISFKVRVEKYY